MELDKNGRAEQVGLRWRRALDAYAAAVAVELHTLYVQVIDWTVDVTEIPFSIELAAVDVSGDLIEFYFSDDSGWMYYEGDQCGRLTATTTSRAREAAVEVALPPAIVAAEILHVLAGHEWPTPPPHVGTPLLTDPQYLAALLDVLEILRAKHPW